MLTANNFDIFPNSPFCEAWRTTIMIVLQNVLHILASLGMRLTYLKYSQCECECQRSPPPSKVLTVHKLFPPFHFGTFSCQPDENAKEKTIEQLKKEVKCYQKAAMLAVTNWGIHHFWYYITNAEWVLRILTHWCYRTWWPVWEWRRRPSWHSFTLPINGNLC